MVKGKVLRTFLAARLDRLREHDDDSNIVAFVEYHMPEMSKVAYFRSLHTQELVGR